MVKQKRRRFSASFKAKVALAAARGDRTLSELGTQFDVHPNLIAQWKKQLIENADHLFSKSAAERGDTEGLLKEAHAKIGQLTLERDFLAGGLARTAGPNVKR